ncbi:MAG: hypothetical protein NTV97_09330 [Alphaproteobacteria bacterium]|nr:hypothetical protein [Alphaproteobacteria bacterium]
MGFFVLSVVALLFFVAMAMSVMTARGSDAAGNGLTAAFAIGFSLALWTVLAILLSMARAYGVVPGWAMACLVVFVPILAIGTCVAIGLYSESGGSIIVVPLALPLLMYLYAVWARFLAP